MPMCLIGRAHFQEVPKHLYQEALSQWGIYENGTISEPRCQCDDLIKVAKNYLGWGEEEEEEEEGPEVPLHRQYLLVNV